MPVLTFFGLDTESGQDLLDQYVVPACRRHGVRLRIAPRRANRGTALAAHVGSDFVLWDGSVEGPYGVYVALDMRAKTSRRSLIVSRTPLPRNVLTYHQCAPIHGQLLSNDVLGEWLDRHLALARAGQGGPRPGEYPGLANQYWMFDNPARYFLSFRGTHEDAATRWRAAFARQHHTSVRMVPANEYSYPTEVLTQQQMWEGAARLLREVYATENLLIYPSTDYFDSFWTGCEFLVGLWELGGGRPRRDGRPLQSVRVADPSGLATRPLADFVAGAGMRIPSRAEMRRFSFLINASDPITSAPETQLPPTGLTRLLARVVSQRGFYLPEFGTESFWHRVRVPCPICRPRHRPPHEVDWSTHLRLPNETPEVDSYGYFPASPADLGAGTIRCPSCGTSLQMANRRGVRTLWVPVQTTERDKDRPVIQEHKVWEVFVPTGS